MRSRIIAVPIFAACVVVAAACGSDSDSKDKAPTKAEYITSADKICETGDKKLEDETKDLDANDDQDFNKYRDLTVASLEDQLKQLRDLTPPEGDADAVDKVYDSLQSAVDALDKATPETLTDVVPKLEEASTLAKDYGMKTCGQEDEAEPETTGSRTTAPAANAPTKEEYIVEADEICSSLQQEFGTAAANISDTSPEADIEVFQETVSASIRDHADQLRALTPPAGDEDTLDGVYSELEGVADTIETTPANELLTIDDPFAAADQAAQDYGFQVCGS